MYTGRGVRLAKICKKCGERFSPDTKFSIVCDECFHKAMKMRKKKNDR